MKHLKKNYNLLKSWIISIPRTIESLFAPNRAHLRKRQGERILLMRQLENTILSNNDFRSVQSRRGTSFSKHTAKIELQKKFLDSITNCKLEDFEDIASKWMKRMRKV